MSPSAANQAPRGFRRKSQYDGVAVRKSRHGKCGGALKKLQLQLATELPTGNALATANWQLPTSEVQN